MCEDQHCHLLIGSQIILLSSACAPFQVGMREDGNDTQFNYNREVLLIIQWGFCLLKSKEREQQTMSEAQPSGSPTLWPTECALWASVPGRHPEQDPALPDIQTHLRSTVAAIRSEPDPHFYFPLCVSLIVFDFFFFPTSFIRGYCMKNL